MQLPARMDQGPERQPRTDADLRVPLSVKLWDLDWSRVLPWTIEGVTVEHASFDEALPFVGEHYAAIFGTAEASARFLVEPMTPAKRRFGGEMDVFLFRDGGRSVGVHMSHPTDWSTYYMRTTALLPEYRGRGIVSRFMELVVEPLRAAGVARIEGDVAPTNTPMVKLNLAQGFVVTATTTSERWGVNLRLTKFLSDEAERVFARQFCTMAVRPARSPGKKPTTARRTP
jgi:ribosomal protein S18 acetylase RimI-like enzyme